MEMIWNADGCKRVSSQLNESANKLMGLITSELEQSINMAKNAYSSASADEIIRTLKQLQGKGPDFINAVKRCSAYLSSTVAPAYEAAERKAANSVGSN